MPWKQLAKGDPVDISIGSLRPTVLRAPNGKILAGVKLYVNGKLSKQGMVFAYDKVVEIKQAIEQLLAAGGGSAKIELATKFIEVNVADEAIDIMTRWNSGGVIGQSLRVEVGESDKLLGAIDTALGLTKLFNDANDPDYHL